MVHRFIERWTRPTPSLQPVLLGLAAFLPGEGKPLQNEDPGDIAFSDPEGRQGGPIAVLPLPTDLHRPGAQELGKPRLRLTARAEALRGADVEDANMLAPTSMVSPWMMGRPSTVSILTAYISEQPRNMASVSTRLP